MRRVTGLLFILLSLLPLGCGDKFVNSNLSDGDRSSAAAAAAAISTALNPHSVRQMLEGRMSVPVSLCNGTGIQTNPNISVTASCPIPTQLQIKFNSKAPLVYNCKTGGQITISSASGLATLDYSGFNLTATPPYMSGTLGEAMNMSLMLNGKLLQCNLALTLNFSNPTSGGLNCANYSCTYGGVALSCSDIRQKFNSAQCTKAS
jgi:hypothetical protein